MWLAIRRALVALLALASAVQAAEDPSEVGSGRHHRDKRLVFTFNSATGVLCALSIPLIVPGRNIFVSYNFEMNYNMPTDSTDYTQGVLKRVDTPEINSVEGRGATEGGANATNGSEQGKTIRRSATFTRKKTYRTLEINLNKWVEGIAFIVGARMFANLVLFVQEWVSTESDVFCVQYAKPQTSR